MRPSYHIKVTPVHCLVYSAFRPKFCEASWPWPLTSWPWNGITSYACSAKPAYRKPATSLHRLSLLCYRPEQGRSTDWWSSWQTDGRIATHNAASCVEGRRIIDTTRAIMISINIYCLIHSINMHTTLKPFVYVNCIGHSESIQRSRFVYRERSISTVQRPPGGQQWKCRHVG